MANYVDQEAISKDNKNSTVPVEHCTIIIPVYNNAGTLQDLISELDLHLKGPGRPCEVSYLFVDDGSDDESWTVIESVIMNRADIRGIRFSRNFGQVAAIIAGFNESIAGYAINISADLQDPPEVIKRIAQELLKGQYEVVIGRRDHRMDGLYRKLSSRLFYAMQRRCIWPNMPVGGFDIVGVTNAARSVLVGSVDSNPFFQGMVLWLGYRIKEIGYIRRKRPLGKSGWTIWKKFKYFIDGVLSYTYLPIRIMTIVGLTSCITGLSYAAVIIIEYFNGNAPFKGWAPIMIVVLLLSGIQMVMIGVVGEYLWRVYDNTKKRPLYVVEAKKSCSDFDN